MSSPEATPSFPPAVILVTGIPGAGKTTVARHLAARFPRGVHIEADLLQGMIVSGGAWPEPPEPRGKAAEQLRLRAHNSSLLARSFFFAGFHVVVDDIIIGDRLDAYLGDLNGFPLYLVRLLPRIDVVKARNAGRPKDVFDVWGYLDRDLRSSMGGAGVWVDSSDQTVEETVDEILDRVWLTRATAVNGDMCLTPERGSRYRMRIMTTVFDGRSPRRARPCGVGRRHARL